MNISTNNTVRTLGFALAAFVLLALSFTFANKANAADLLSGGYDVYDYSGGYDTYDYSGGYDVYDYSGGYSGGYDTYDYSGGYDVYDYSGGYDTYGYSSPTYSAGSGFTGGFTFGGGGYGGGSGYSNVYAPTNTSVFAPTNTCTATNSCNTTTQINAPTNIVTNTTAPASYPVYQPVYTQPVYTQVNTQPVYYPAPRPIAYNNTPYVTLAAVPYTGLELGFWGTIAYWGFLVLWCLFAAYLIVVKKVHNKLAAWFTGSTPQNSAVQKSSDFPSSGALRATPAGQTFARQNSAPLFAGIDSFVLSQINRAK